MHVGAIANTILIVFTIVIAIKAREEILLEQELLPVTQQEISRNELELEMLALEPNTVAQLKEFINRGGEFVKKQQCKKATRVL